MKTSHRWLAEQVSTGRLFFSSRYSDDPATVQVITHPVGGWRGIAPVDDAVVHRIEEFLSQYPECRVGDLRFHALIAKFGIVPNQAGGATQEKTDG